MRTCLESRSVSHVSLAPVEGGVVVVAAPAAAAGGAAGGAVPAVGDES